MKLKPWIQVVEPHDDIRKGKISTENGLIKAPTPMTNVELMMIEPKVLPNARWVDLLITDFTDMINSGKVVADAKKTVPSKNTGIAKIEEN